MYADLWLKRVLVPAWVAQLLLNCFYVVITAFTLRWMSRVNYKDINRPLNDPDNIDTDISQEDFDRLMKYTDIYLGVFISIAALGIIFSIVEIVLFSRKRLSPVLMVFLNALAVLVWAVLVGLNAYSAHRSMAVGLIWPILLFAVYLGKLIYASVILHRVRKGRAGARGTYAAPAEMGVAYDGTTAYNAGAKHGNVEYYSPEAIGYNGRA